MGGGPRKLSEKGLSHKIDLKAPRPGPLRQKNEEDPTIRKKTSTQSVKCICAKRGENCVSPGRGGRTVKKEDSHHSREGRGDHAGTKQKVTPIETRLCESAAQIGTPRATHWQKRPGHHRMVDSTIRTTQRDGTRTGGIERRTNTPSKGYS